MSLTSGSRLGSYEILGPLGQGGMGAVYRARDTKLNRDVALKVLPDNFAADPERVARFKREAQLLAALNHPHIAAIYGVEEAAPAPAGSHQLQFLVLELVEGETLAQRIARLNAAESGKSRGLEVNEALAIARQIVDALIAAHDKGIIHRDLKPANIALTGEGQVKVLDFGLARQDDGGAGRSGGSGRPGGSGGMGELTHSPTMTFGATQAGMILGTAAYMSPEQAKGRVADKRSDVWAFGCVLFEMLTGKRAFEGEDVSDTLAAVLRGDPDWSAMPASVPAPIRTLTRRCLEKDRKNRIADVAVVDYVLNEPEPAPAPVAPPAAVTRPAVPVWRRVAQYLSVALLAAALAGAGVWLATRPRARPVTRTTIAQTPTAQLVVNGNDRDVAISPDGARMVYSGGVGNLFVRSLDQLDPAPIAGIIAARGPFFSPDGQWIGFFESSQSLKKVSVTGGPAVTICRIDGTPRGASWGPDGTIVFATANPVSGLVQVSAAGGEPKTLTKPNRETDGDHFWPEFLPDGRAVLFTKMPRSGTIDNAQVAVFDLATRTEKVLVQGGSHAHYSPSGHLVYGVAGTLRATAFDPGKLEVSGTPVPVVPQVVTTGVGAADFDLTRDGTLVYVAGGGLTGGSRSLVWVDRNGAETPIKAPPRAYLYPRLSPDGTRIAIDIRDQENDVWVWDVARETLTRLTFDGRLDRLPVWSPDGKRIIFSSERDGIGNLYSQAADGTGTIERLTNDSTQEQIPTSISPDGSRIVFFDNAVLDVLMATLDKDKRAIPLVKTMYVERNGEISPDGRWLVYESNESGQFEIYVRPFPNVDSGRWQASTGGGQRPAWSRNGLELFYVSPGGALMAMRVEPGQSWQGGNPTKVVEGRYFFAGGFTGRTYDVSPDGRRFLMIKPVSSEQGAAPPAIVLVQNWGEELERLVPRK